MYNQGCNFGLKSGVPIQKENEVPLSPEARGEENGEKVSLLIQLWGLWECLSSPAGWGEALAENSFVVI